ncbi:glycosyltransferase family 1 protein [Pleurocapsa sp. CCALA 161]|uniref:glycosyltransferase family 4 protein n=1 Tax=Pleurocapsa sp. CCALA 161 TaxID=2107688 RepID=UPI000D051835|nr:glycosyltransferase family 4 protein [Pleurocapsa sp. CCALA 161]PSB09472.1 glycosyltransferase family 1 protein [Pleurocapsa sp. CCALA 161]
MDKRKIALIKHGDFSYINPELINILQTNFANFPIEIIDIYTDLLSKKDLMSLVYCLKEFGVDILLQKKQINTATYLKLPYTFNKIKEKVRKRLADQRYICTFQTQSLFDASVPGIPHFVYTDHTYLAYLQYPGFDSQNLPSQTWLEYEKSIYQNATFNFTMSSNISQSLIESYSCDPEKIACVYCGANVQAKRDEIFDDHRFSKQNILFVGVEWERKGGPVLVEAFKKVLETYPNATLTIVGCKPKLSIPNCNIVGRVPIQDVKQFYQQASIFCLPTTLEPFGIVFLEAMAHKLPVIGSDLGAIPEFIIEGQNGYRVEPNNPQQLAQKIIELISHPEKCKIFGECGHKLFWNRYTWEKTGLRMRQHMEQFLT